jgi:SPP1 family predicted phage head-tail adaptor
MASQNQYFLKDKKAEIFKGTATRDKYGNYINSYVRQGGAALWCYARQISQDITLQAAMYGSNENRMFVFNYREGIEVGDLIRYNSKWYTITRIDTTDDYNTDLFIYVSDTATGSIPKNSEIVL